MKGGDSCDMDELWRSWELNNLNLLRKRMEGEVEWKTRVCVEVVGNQDPRASPGGSNQGQQFLSHELDSR